MSIYLDHNAGSPLRPEVRRVIAACADSEHGNPASVHRAGQRARRMFDQAREQVASLIGAASAQVVFTSGGTESNNLAIFGAARARSDQCRIVSCAIEHSSVIVPLAALEREGLEVTRVPVDREGRIDAGAAADTVDDHTAMVTFALANSEVGTIQPLAPLAEAVHRCGATFHIDAAQALGRIPVSIDALDCDLMTISGHKLGAPAGVGALFVRDPSRIAPLLMGGPQEIGLRAGTPNLLGAVAFGAAAAAADASLADEGPRLERLTARLLVRLFESIPGLRLNGALHDRLPNTLNLTFPGVLGESMLIALDLEGVEVSMGSACAAGAVEPSHVLLAMGLGRDEARSSLRISLGWSTTEAEIEQAGEVIARVWRQVKAAEAPESLCAGGLR